MVRAVAMLVVLSAALPAAAQEREADALVREGVELRRQGRDAEALQRFERAHALAPSPRTLGQIGLAEQALGRWVDAERHLAEALAADHPWIRSNRPDLEDALRTVRARVARLEVLGGVAGARVLVDGVEVGVLPLAEPLRLVAGVVALEVRVDGYATVARQVTLAGGELTRETIEMHPAAVGGDPVSGGAAVEPARGGSRVRAIGWATLATGGALGIVALATGLVAHGRYGDIDDQCRPEPCPPELRDDADRGSRLASTSTALTFIGAAAAVTGVVLIAVGGGRPSPEAAARIELWPGGLSARVRF